MAGRSDFSSAIGFHKLLPCNKARWQLPAGLAFLVYLQRGLDYMFFSMKVEDL